MGCECASRRCRRAKIPTRWSNRAAPRHSSPSWTPRWISSNARSSCSSVKGWFEGVDHQREALDRLLPTIRAASDPIMRDLYLKKVSERTGVSREVLQEQAARPGYGSADRQPPAPESRHAQGNPVSRPPAKRRKVDAAERDLLRVLMKEPGWRERAAKEIPADWFETPELREVFQALTGSPETVESGLFLEHLSPGAQASVGLARQHRAQVRFHRSRRHLCRCMASARGPPIASPARSARTAPNRAGRRADGC